MEGSSSPNSQRTPTVSLTAAKGLVPDDKLKNLENKVAPQTPAAPGGVPENPAPQNPANQNPPNNDQPVVQQVIEIKTPLGSKVFGAPQSSNEPIKIATVEDVYGMITAESGIKISTPQEIVDHIIIPLKTLKEQNAVLPAMQARVDTLETLITQMPVDLAQVMNAYVHNEDYGRVMENLISSKSIDFTREFRDLDQVQVINHFMKANYTKETFEALEPNIQDSLKTSTRILFDNARKSFVQPPSVKQVVDSRVENFNASVNAAIENLKIQFPTMPPERVSEIKDLLLSKGFAKRLFSQDGTYKPNAGVEISTMIYGREALQVQEATISQLMEKAQNQGFSKATEQIIYRSDNPTIHGGGAGGGGGIPQQSVTEKVKKQTSFLTTSGNGEKF